MPAPDLDGIEPRIIEQIVVAQAHHARLADLDARQAGYGAPEVDLGLGIVHEPAPSETIAEIGVLKAREAKFRCGSAARRIAACGHREGRYRNRAEPSAATAHRHVPSLVLRVGASAGQSATASHARTSRARRGRCGRRSIERPDARRADVDIGKMNAKRAPTAPAAASRLRLARDYASRTARITRF